MRKGRLSESLHVYADANGSERGSKRTECRDGIVNGYMHPSKTRLIENCRLY